MAPFGFPFDCAQSFGKTGQAWSRALPKICSGRSFSTTCEAGPCHSHCTACASVPHSGSLTSRCTCSGITTYPYTRSPSCCRTRSSGIRR